jgi:hypothetical protein
MLSPFGEGSQGAGLGHEFKAELLRPLRVVAGDVADNLLQVLDRARGENYYEIHDGSVCATSSSGVPSPRSN